MLLLRDPLQLMEQSVLIPQELAPLLLLCDGTRARATIHTLLAQHFHLSIDENLLDHVITTLDETFLLENGRAQEEKARHLTIYRGTPFRPPALAGSSYPADPGALHRLLQDYLEAADTEPDTVLGRGLLSPHIDYPRGGEIYAQVWKRAAPTIQAADLIVILATDHYGGHNPFTLTRQNYATPYGALPTEQRVVDALASALGEDAAFAGELHHRTEHSIELVAVWLQHLRNQEPVPVVPILCGSFAEHVYNGNPLAQNPIIDTFITTLRAATAGRNVVYVISGDLSHVGPAFGGAPLDETGRKHIKTADDELITNMLAGNAAGFFNTIQKVHDENNVCGTIPIYLALQLMGTITGEPIGYAQCPADEHNTSLVSVCGVVFK